MPPEASDHRAINSRAYDAAAGRYLDWSRANLDPGRPRYLAKLAARLRPGSRLLELGCGPGVPVVQELSGAHRVIGMDISRGQLDLARRNAPAAAYVQADMVSVAFGPASLDAVAAFYSIIHVPREAQPALLDRIFGWLRPGGLFVATMGTGDSEGWLETWLDVPMFFSTYPTQANLAMVRRAGFQILESEVISQGDPKGIHFLWVLAAKPPAGSQLRRALAGAAAWAGISFRGRAGD